ncbi:MAG TPA: type II secretion system F family protein [Candidatus Nitrosotenuis sp.]|jgi:type IV pilus assembly protein PilC|nr:type II secretion system F family protein [Candidatus Nitrosotenuis sp.]
MPRFAYEALDSRGRHISGVVEAPNAEAVIRDLRNVKCTVTNIREAPERFNQVREWFKRLQRSSLYALAIFTRQLAVVLNSGVPAVRGLESLGRQALNPRLAQAVHQVYEDLKQGQSMAKAMSRHPDVFSAVYVSMIKAGEMSGAMGEILERLANLLEREVGLRKKVQAATTYPALVFLACMGVVAFLVNYVFPRFIEMFKGIDVELPLITRSLIMVTDAFRNPMVMGFMLLALGAGVWLMMQYFKTPRGKRQLDQFVLDMPLLGPVMKKVALSRFCRTLGTLLASGVPVVHSLEIVSRASGNEVICDIIDEVQMGLKAGMRLSQPLREYKIFPPMLSQMVAVGEETGNLPVMLNKLADFYDMEVEHTLEAFTAMLEPIMIAFMGVVTGYVLLAVFLPVYGIMNKF